MDTTSLVTLSTLGTFAFATGLLKEEIKAARSDYKIYKNRFLDTNGDPKDPDVGLMCNPSTGEWGPIIVDEYSYSLFCGPKRFVRFRHIDLVEGTGKERQLSLAKFEAAARARPEEPLRNSDWTRLAGCGLTAPPKTEETSSLQANQLTTALKDVARSLDSVGGRISNTNKTLKSRPPIDIQEALLTESVIKELTSLLPALVKDSYGCNCSTELDCESLAGRGVPGAVKIKPKD